MITVISGTNRPGSLTRAYAEHFYELFKNELDAEVQFLSLEDLPSNMVHSGMYKGEEQSPELAKIQDRYVLNAEAFFIVMPEYNGSYPGILKTFLDAVSIREYAKSFSGKRVGLFGVASGRAGNLRGIDHLTGVLHHVGCHVMPKAMPFGQAQLHLNEERKIAVPEIKDELFKYAQRFLTYSQASTKTSSVS